MYKAKPLAPRRSRPWWEHPPFWIGFTALAARTLHLLLYRSDFWMRTPLLDDNLFLEWSETIRREGWLARSLGIFDLNPAYPYLLSVLHRLGLASATAVFAFQHIAGSCVPVFIYFITQRLFDRRTAIVSGILAAFYGPAFFYEARYLGEFWIYFFNTAMLLAFVFAYHDKRPEKFCALAGLCLGFSATFRPTVLVLVPLAIVWGTIELKAQRVTWVKTIVLFLIGVWLPLLPFQLRNRCVVPSFGWGLTTASGGVNLYLGNNPEADGLNAAPSFVRYGPSHEYLDFKEEAERRVGQSMSAKEVSAYYLSQTMVWFRQHPGPAFTLLLRKAGYFWNYHEPPDNFFLSMFESFTRLGSVPLFGWSLIAPVGLAGMLCLGFYRPPPTAWLLVEYVWVYFGLNVAFYVLSRYRFPAAAGLIPLAAWMGVQFYDTFERGAMGRVVILGSVIAACFALSRLDLIGDEIPEIAHFSKGVIYANQGWKDQAVEEYRASIQANPHFKAAHLNLGILEAGLGHGTEAVNELTQAEALETDPVQKQKIHNAVEQLQKIR